MNYVRLHISPELLADYQLAQLVHELLRNVNLLYNNITI